MKTKKKNRFLTFCFSLMPGAAEMYMGFMKAGVSLMTVFFLICAVGGWTRQVVIVMFAVVIWFYSFFHANHLASLSDEEFEQIKDEYLFGLEMIPEAKAITEKYHTLIACILIFIGVCCLWNSLADLIHDLVPQSYRFISSIMYRIGSYVPSIIIGVGVIVIGIRMIRGKKPEAGSQETQAGVEGSREMNGEDEK